VYGKSIVINKFEKGSIKKYGFIVRVKKKGIFKKKR
jgi:hypothetical protein